MRDWVALYPSILDSDKWADLDAEERLAWVVTLLLAAQQPTEGRFDSQRHLSMILRKEGFAEAPDIVDGLLRNGVLDDEDGEVVVRGWNKWQKRWRGPSDDPGAAAERMRRLREDRSTHVRPVFDQQSNGSPSSIEERRGEDREERTVARATPPGDDDRDSLDRFYELTMLRPWGKNSGKWLRDLQDGYGVDAVVDALDEEYRQGVDNATLISRAEARLAKAADKTRQTKVKATKAPVVVDPEIAARQQAALREMVGGVKSTGGQG